MNLWSGIVITLGLLPNHIVFQNESIQPGFLLSNYYNTCNPPQLTILSNQQEGSRLFRVPIMMRSESIVNANLSYHTSNIIRNEYHQHQEAYNLTFYDTLSFYIYHLCPDDLNNDNYWGLIDVTISLNDQPINFQYISNCNEHYIPQKFDFSYLIIIGAGVLTIFSLARFGQIRTFRMQVKHSLVSSVNNYAYFSEKQIFQGIYINYWYFFGYVGLITLMLGIEMVSHLLETYTLITFSLILNIFFMAEVFSTINILQTRICYHIKICDILGVLIGCLPTLAFIEFYEYWIVNDIIYLLNLGAFLKLFKITSFKDAFTLYLPFLITMLATSIYFYFAIKYNWYKGYVQFMTNIITLQAPLFVPHEDKKCATIELNTFFLPGLMIAYTYRYAQSKGSYVYFTVYMFGLLFGLILWLSTTFLNTDFMLPNIYFTLVPASSICMLLSYKRNEQREFWGGYFYDELLLNPFNRKKLEQSNIQELVNVQKTSVVPDSQRINDKIFDGLFV